MLSYFPSFLQLNNHNEQDDMLILIYIYVRTQNVTMMTVNDDLCPIFNNISIVRNLLENIVKIPRIRMKNECVFSYLILILELKSLYFLLLNMIHTLMLH